MWVLWHFVVVFGGGVSWDLGGGGGIEENWLPMVY